MSAFHTIFQGLSRAKFDAILATASRSARETYYQRLAISAPKTRLPRPGAKNLYRNQALYDALCRGEDEAVCQELLRNWLLQQRPLLITALDHLNIPHTDGLTTSNELNRFASLEGASLAELRQKLSKIAPPEDVDIYLQFMRLPDNTSPTP